MDLTVKYSVGIDVDMSDWYTLKRFEEWTWRVILRMCFKGSIAYHLETMQSGIQSQNEETM